MFENIIFLVGAMTSNTMLTVLLVVLIVLSVLMAALSIVFIIALKKRSPVVKVVMPPNDKEKNGAKTDAEEKTGKTAAENKATAQGSGAKASPHRAIDPEIDQF